MAAQSPLDGYAQNADRDYLLSWAVTTRLMAEGKSFSGRERNTVFLNTGGRGFADVSAVSGFNFIDDARAIGLTDFDFDGDIDFWVANRGAPRVRLMRNDMPADGQHWLGLELVGSDSNRDAVGARVTVRPAPGEAPVTRTVRAGEGFLSQSSKRLHFGLGGVAADEGELEVVVRWPAAGSMGGATERFSGVRADGFYRLNEGGGVAEPAAFPPAGAVAGGAAARSEPQAVPEPSGRARIALAGRQLVPTFDLASTAGSEDVVRSVGRRILGQPVLLNFWATWCAPCLAELKEFAEAADALRDAGLEVVAINVDDPDAAPGADRLAAAERVLGEIGYEGAAAVADAGTLAVFDLFQRTLTQLQRPMPVPTSILVDGSGRAAVVYKGAVGVEQLLADVAALGLRGEELRDWATPVAGRWVAPPPLGNPLRFAMKAFDAGLGEQAEAYLRQVVADAEARKVVAGAEGRALREPVENAHFAIARFCEARGDSAAQAAALVESVKANPRFRKGHLRLGELLMERRDFAGAARFLTQAAAIGEPDADALNRLALAKMGNGEFRDAEVHSRDALKVAPRDPSAFYNLGFALQRQGRWAESAAAYREVLELEPSRLMAANNLAWVLATAPDDDARNGEQSLQIAAQLAQHAGDRQPVFWMTLGAAFAETGRFDQAVDAAMRALKVLEASGLKTGLSEQLDRQVERYRSQQPWRDPVEPAGGD